MACMHPSFMGLSRRLIKSAFGFSLPYADSLPAGPSDVGTAEDFLEKWATSASKRCFASKF